MKGINWVAERIYVCMVKLGFVLPHSVRNNLEKLNPGVDTQELCRTFVMAKLQKSLLIIGVGGILAITLSVKASSQRVITDNEIMRQDVLGEEEKLVVETALDGQKERFEVLLHPVQMDTLKTQESYEEFVAALPGLIKGLNPSLSGVTKNLVLLDCYEGYPFTVEWKSNDRDVINTSGEVNLGDEEKKVCLRALISYGEEEWEESFDVSVAPLQLTERERKHRKLEKLLVDSQSETITSQSWMLPSGMDGMELKWERVVDDFSIPIFLCAVFVGVAVFFLKDQDIRQENEKRKTQMKMEYPDIVHKLVLYIGAGMTIQGAFSRITMEYEKRKRTGGSTLPAYEEILYTCREINSGVAEGIAYERMGKRIGLQEYIRLCTLLSQNLRKGSSSLIIRLEEEANRAGEEKLREGRKLGEEAATKLLLPMIMLLSVVMVMVMLPAFQSMGG